MLRKWLKAGVIEKNVFHLTDEGTPQGGILSPTLANITLDGMEDLVAKYSNRKENGKTFSNKVNLVRYADDFIVTGEYEGGFGGNQGGTSCVPKGKRI